MSLDNVFSQFDRFLSGKEKCLYVNTIKEYFVAHGFRYRNLDLYSFKLSELKSFLHRIKSRVEKHEKILGKKSLEIVEKELDVARTCFEGFHYTDFDDEYVNQSIPGYSLIYTLDDGLSPPIQYVQPRDPFTSALIKKASEYVKPNTKADSIINDTDLWLKKACDGITSALTKPDVPRLKKTVKRNTSNGKIGCWPCDAEIPPRTVKNLVSSSRPVQNPEYQRLISKVHNFLGSSSPCENFNTRKYQFTNHQTMSLNLLYGTLADPRPFGHCWTLLFSFEDWEELCDKYPPYMSIIDVYDLVTKKNYTLNDSFENINLIMLDNKNFHITLFPIPGVKNQFSVPAFSALAWMYMQHRDTFDNKEEFHTSLLSKLLKNSENYYRGWKHMGKNLVVVEGRIYRFMNKSIYSSKRPINSV